MGVDVDVQIYDRTTALLGQMLQLQSERHRAVVSNLANQDTPGYKAVEVDFTQALENATASEAGRLPVAVTHPRHIAIGGAPPDFPSGAVLSTITRSNRLDGNSVNAEMEMAKLSQNSLMYNATAEILSAKFRTIRSAIRGTE